jgi:hypothetical protein
MRDLEEFVGKSELVYPLQLRLARFAFARPFPRTDEILQRLPGVGLRSALLS